MRYQPRMQGSVMPGSAAYPSFAHTDVATTHSRILGFLGRALSLELSAGQHYLAQASLAKFRHEIPYAQAFITLANEEFQHANQITDRMVAQGALPAGSVLAPSEASHNIVEALNSCEVREIALIQLYDEAAQFCHNMGAMEDFGLFSQLLAEEQAQLNRVRGWLAEYFEQFGQSRQPTRGFV
ncbi:ferritin-like domain-containing protein [Thiosulfativibrio zosterae]|uniref:Ferritin-like diiron domain-containing protein n=1 Tax=Thiosulfativibrio zosterae TaxID=2675053 RepID=A0A6F8PPS1_9GAMM|nr:ferritin-like domain-containing protein [Thiosulfativibrio zosterae]BBP44121.1 hypothetical protein THMIRHAT_18670 [Thiosulfativibrio zosterae]